MAVKARIKTYTLAINQYIPEDLKTLLAITLIFFSLHTKAQDRPAAVIFWEQLQKHCGMAYAGTINEEANSGDFKDKQLIMHFRSCEKGKIRIPFMIGDNRSRTWVLTLENDRILLKHDHRHQDGTEEEVSWYGGRTTNQGSASMQVFPADEETQKRIPAAFGNIWWITIDAQFFTYNLRRIGTDRLVSVKFDLTNPISIPAAPWGWID
jgi:hypothetical protein